MNFECIALALPLIQVFSFAEVEVLNIISLVK